MAEHRDRVERVVAIEEHVWTPALREALLELGGDETITTWSNEESCNKRLLDVGDERLARMDAMGVDFQVLSITAPGVQQLPSQIAVSLASEANDFLAGAVQRHPDKFAAFATLPAQAPEAAAEELRRCVSGMGFVGAMLFPRAGSLYLDHVSFRPIFEVAAELKVPLYIHPGVPLDAVREACYSGFSAATNLMLATGGWGWHAEAGLAALRLILAGTFERHPDLQIILGHMGEMLIPFADRADALTKTTDFERSVLDCITGNFYATPGGVFSHRMLRQNLDVVGPDRVMFAVDDPYKGTLGQQGKATFGTGFCREFIESAPISVDEKAKLAHLNAERLLLSRNSDSVSGD
jgi:predicted TIM-barrel fold metal-dependent hydrolase